MKPEQAEKAAIDSVEGDFNEWLRWTCRQAKRQWHTNDPGPAVGRQPLALFRRVFRSGMVAAYRDASKDMAEHAWNTEMGEDVALSLIGWQCILESRADALEQGEEPEDAD